MSVYWKLTAAFLLGLLLCEFVTASDPVVYRPIYGWNFLTHSSTPIESVLRGQAAWLESAGQASYYDSMAALNYQQAYKQSLENRLLRTEVYYSRKEMAKEYQQRYAEKPPTLDDVKRIARVAAPARLTPQQFDTRSGRLNWPHVLRDARYDPVRNKIDSLMVSRSAENSGDGSPSHAKIRQLVEVMKMLLKENMDRVTPQQYANAKAFLVSLEFEARQQL